MRNMKRVLASLLAVILMFTMVPFPAMAAETYGYEVITAPSPAVIGGEVVLTFRLTDYTKAKSGIRGFQIDITDVDDVLHEAVCTSLVTDTEDLLSNTAKYQKNRDIVRHAYVKMSGAMSYENADLLEVKFTVPETYTEAGTLSLPLKVLIQNEAGDKITYTDTIRIDYYPENEIPDQTEPDDGDNGNDGDEEQADPQIVLSHDYLLLVKGDAAQLSAVVEPSELQDQIQWTTDNESVVSVNEDGVITSHSVGTAYVAATVKNGATEATARCRVDVTERVELDGIQLSTQTLTTELYKKEYAAFEILLLLPQNYTPAAVAYALNEQNIGVAIERVRFTDEATAQFFEIAVMDDRSVLVIPTDYALEHPGEVGSKYVSTVLVTVQGQEFESEALTLTVKKTMPKLKATVPAFNSFYSGQSQTISVTGGTPVLIYPDESKNTAKTSAIPDWLTVNNDILTLTGNAPLRSTSVKAYLLVETEEWAIPAAVTLTVKNTYKAPGLKLSATSVTMSPWADASNGVELKLQCKNKKDTLAALNVKNLGAPEDSAFLVENFNAEDGSFTLKAKEGFKVGKLTLYASFTDTEVAVPLTLTVKTQTVRLKTAKNSISINKAVADSAAVTVTATPADYVVDLTSEDLYLTDSRGNALEDPGVLDVSAEGDQIRIAVNDKTPDKATYKLSIASGGAKTTMTVKVTTDKPAVTYKAAGSLDHSFPEKPATVTPIFSNCGGSFTIAGMTAENGKKVDATEQFRAEKDGNRIVIRCAEDTAVGSYTLKLTLSLNDGTTVANTVKVTVKRTAVKLKLSATSLSLNKLVSGKGEVNVTCTTKGYDFTEPVWQLMDKTGKNSAEGKLDISYADGKLTVGANENTAYGATYKVLVKANENAPAATLTVTVPAETRSNVTSSLKASGKIDVIRDGSAVIVAPSYKNCTAQTEWEEELRIYSSADQYSEPVNDLFCIEPNGEGGYSITRAAGAALDHSNKYKVKLVSTCGDVTVESAMVSFKVTMGSAKLTVRSYGSTMFARDKYDQALVWFDAKDTALNGVSGIEIKEAKYRDMFEITDYGDGIYAISYKDNAVHSSLITKRRSTTVTLTLNIFLEGNQTAKVNTTAKLKLTIVK